MEPQTEETRYLYRHNRTYGNKPLEFDAFPVIKETAAQYVVKMTNHFGEKYEKRVNKGRMIMDYEKWFPSPEAGARWFLDNREARVADAQKNFDQLDERIASLREHAVEFLDRTKRERDAFLATNAALLPKPAA